MSRKPRPGARRGRMLLRADVADLAEGRQLVDTTIERHGRVDLWVNNAGIAPERRDDLLETTPESWDRVVATNLRGPFFLTQAVANAMIAPAWRRELSHEPQIVFISSISSRFASVNRAGILRGQGGLEHGRPSSLRCTAGRRREFGCTRSGRG